MSADSLATVIRNLAQQLAESLRGGDALVSDARSIYSTVREAEGWLQSARRFLDPSDPLSQQERVDESGAPT